MTFSILKQRMSWNEARALFSSVDEMERLRKVFVGTLMPSIESEYFKGTPLADLESLSIEVRSYLGNYLRIMEYGSEKDFEHFKTGKPAFFGREDIYFWPDGEDCLNQVGKLCLLPDYIHSHLGVLWDSSGKDEYASLFHSAEDAERVLIADMVYSHFYLDNHDGSSIVPRIENARLAGESCESCLWAGWGHIHHDVDGFWFDEDMFNSELFQKFGAKDYYKLMAMDESQRLGILNFSLPTEELYCVNSFNNLGIFGVMHFSDWSPEIMYSITESEVGRAYRDWYETNVAIPARKRAEEAS